MTPTTIFAIDPGKTGAIAIYRVDLRQLTIHDMPITGTTKGKTTTNLRALYDILAPEGGRSIACVESVSPRPGEGAVSAFTFGRGVGAIDMACTAHGHEMRSVSPSQWKKHFGLIFPKDTAKTLVKSASRTMACNRFPAMAHHFARVKDDGRAEAALIAIYAAEVML